MQSRLVVTALTTLLIGTILVAALASSMSAVSAETGGNNAKQSTSTSDKIKFTVKLGNATDTALSPPHMGPSSKIVTVGIKIIKDNTVARLNVTSQIPANATDLSFCASVHNASEVCKPILLVMDLSGTSGKSANSTSTADDDSQGKIIGAIFNHSSGAGNTIRSVDMFEESLTNITQYISATIIVPTAVQTQKIDVCGSVSSGATECGQTTMNSQDLFKPVNIDMATLKPTITVGSTNSTSTASSSPAS
jgi:hypothetical protein